MRARRLTALLVAGLLVVGVSTGVAQAAPPPTPAGGLPALSAPAAAGLAQDVSKNVIVVMKNQFQNIPATRPNTHARAGAVAANQSPVINDLEHTGAKHVRSYSLLNSVAATVSPAESSRLAADPNVAAVVPDATVPIREPVVQQPPTGMPNCQPGPDGVELDPEALSVIHAKSTNPNEQTAAGLGITGKDVTVAYMAEQTNVDEPGFIRSDGSHVFVDYKDFTGEGSVNDGSFGGEAILDASSVAAQGNQIFTINGCKFRVEGAAPGASLVGLKVFPEGNLAATTSALLEAIDYAVTVDHVDVLNQSFGYNPLPDTTVDLIRQADQQAIEAGTTVVVSTGDAGPTNTVGSPSTDPDVISAAASTTFRAYAQADIANYTEVGATGWVNNNMSALSSGGITEGVKSPNITAPGDLNWTLYNPKKGTYGAAISGGTSEAAPLTSATAALVIQAYRNTHHGASPTPALIKQIILSTADDLGHPGYEQGSGLLDAYKAVQAAMSVRTPDGSPKPTGSTLLTDTSQLAATAAPGTAENFRVRVTNTGQSTQTVRLSGRTLGAYQPVRTTTVTLGTNSEHFNGLNVEKLTFRVPVGASRLAANIAAPTNDSSLDLTLLDPLGQLEAYSLPQGTGNHGAVEVRYPAFGTWTAIITDVPAASGGYEGPVRFQAAVANYQPFGQVSPASITLAPGAVQTVTVHTVTPWAPGDLSAALVLSAPFGRQTSIPISLRSLVPLAGGAGSFRTTVTGGNGRGGAPADTKFYQFDVPAGQQALDVQTAITAGAVDDYNLFLVDPSGETVGHASNQLIVGTGPNGPITVTERGARAHALDPAPGRWTLVAEFSNPVAGTALTTTFAGTVSLAAVTPRVSGLPDSAATKLPAGKPVTATVTVHNNGPAPETYFVDPRLNSTATIELPSYTPATNLTLPRGPASVATPQWIVPTETTVLNAAAEATAPVTFDWAPYLGNLGGDLNGDPDLGAINTGNTAHGTWTGSPVTPGDWMISPALIGPFTAPAPPATVNLAMAATTKAFDRATGSTTGDFWAVEAGQGGTFTPVIVGPGQTTTIYVTITPSGKPGTVVSGTLYLDDASSLSPFGQAIPAGEELAAIPYKYTIG